MTVKKEFDPWVAKYIGVMDRDLWMTSTSSTLGPLLSSQADMDDVLRAATETRPRKRRGLARAERRLRQSVPVEQPVQTETEQLSHS